MPDPMWELNLDGAERNNATAIQLADDIQRQSAMLIDRIRQMRDSAVATAAVLNEARARGSFKGIAASSRRQPKTDRSSLSLKEQAEDLQNIFRGVGSYDRDSLHDWHYEIEKAAPERSRVGIHVTGSWFEPRYGDEPKGNGGAYTVRFRTEAGALPVYMNLGDIILLALIGSKVVRVTAQEAGDDDEDDFG